MIVSRKEQENKKTFLDRKTFTPYYKPNFLGGQWYETHHPWCRQSEISIVVALASTAKRVAV
jgi:hypothetical protein